MTYKVTLELAGIDFDDGDLVAAVSGEFPDFLWGAVDGRSLVSVYADRQDPVKAVAGAAERIERQLPGVRVLRVDEDLVGVPDIARRLGVSREAVRSWALGTRGSGDFPTPRGSIGTGDRGSQRVWAWSDVDSWLGERLGLSDESDYLSPAQVAGLNARFARADQPAGQERGAR